MSKLKKELMMLSVISRIREDYKKMFPDDNVNNHKLTDILHSLAWRIKENDDKEKEGNNSKSC